MTLKDDDCPPKKECSVSPEDNITRKLITAIAVRARVILVHYKATIAINVEATHLKLENLISLQK